jgi:hypothetical protein
VKCFLAKYSKYLAKFFEATQKSEVNVACTKKLKPEVDYITYQTVLPPPAPLVGKRSKMYSTQQSTFSSLLTLASPLPANLYDHPTNVLFLRYLCLRNTV